jgi:hypothetical protein
MPSLSYYLLHTTLTAEYAVLVGGFGNLKPWLKLNLANTQSIALHSQGEPSWCS